MQDLLALGPIRGAEIHGETHGIDCCKKIFGESENYVGERGGGAIPVASNSKSLLISEAHKVAYLHSINGALLVGMGERLGKKDAQDIAPLGPLQVAGEKIGQLPAKK